MAALSQQVQRLERELGVPLLARSTHHVALTAAGAAFLAEARQILAHTDRAAAIAPSAAEASAALRVAIIDSSYDSMPQILHEVQAGYPGLVIHQVEASVPEQYRQLADGRLDVEMCRAADFTPTVHEGTVESIRAAANLVTQGRCLYCVPSSCVSALPGTVTTSRSARNALCP